MNSTYNLVQEVERLTQALSDKDLALMEQTELADKCRKQAETLEAERDQARLAQGAMRSQQKCKVKISIISNAVRGVYLEGYPYDIELKSERLVDAVAYGAAPQQHAQPIHQFRTKGTADWYDGHPDNEDGGGPYEVRTLYRQHAQAVQYEDIRSASYSEMSLGELLERYWNIAFSEGQDGVSRGSEAQEVLSSLMAFGKDAQAALSEDDFREWVVGEIHGHFSYSGERDNQMWADIEDIHFFAKAVADHVLATRQPAPVASTPAVAVPEGWQLVPIELDVDMQLRGDEATSGFVNWEEDGPSDGHECSAMVERIWSAILNAAPQPSAAPVAAEVQGDQKITVAEAIADLLRRRPDIDGDAHLLISLALRLERSQPPADAALVDAKPDAALAVARRHMFSAYSQCLVNGDKMLPQEIADALLAVAQRSASQPEDLLSRTLPPKGYEDCFVVSRNGQLIWLRRDDVLPTDGMCFYDGDCRDVLTPYDSRVQPPIKLAMQDSERDAARLDLTADETTEVLAWLEIHRAAQPHKKDGAA